MPVSRKLGSSLLRQASERQISCLRWVPGAAFRNPWKPDPPCLSGFLPHDLVMGRVSCVGSQHAASDSVDLAQEQVPRRSWCCCSKITLLETSLVVQCLGLCASTAGVMVQFLVRELRSHMPHSQRNKAKATTITFLKNAFHFHWFFFFLTCDCCYNLEIQMCVPVCVCVCRHMCHFLSPYYVGQFVHFITFLLLTKWFRDSKETEAERGLKSPLKWEEELKSRHRSLLLLVSRAWLRYMFFHIF